MTDRLIDDPAWVLVKYQEAKELLGCVRSEVSYGAARLRSEIVQDLDAFYEATLMDDREEDDVQSDALIAARDAMSDHDGFPMPEEGQQMTSNPANANESSARIHLDNGVVVRASETVEQITLLLGDESHSDWIFVADPGDGRQVAVRASRITHVEEEPDDA